MSDVTDTSTASNAILSDLHIVWAFLRECTGSMFQFEEDAVHRLMRDHGLPVNVPFSACFDLLCHHVLSGLCATSHFPACCCIAGSVSMPKLAFEIATGLVPFCEDENLPLTVVRKLCSSLGVRCKRPSTKDRPFFIAGLQRRLLMLESSLGSSLSTIVFDLPKMALDEALIVAAFHGIACTGTVEKVSSVVMGHICGGSCARPDTTCLDIQDNLPADIQTTSDLQAHLLTSVYRTIRKKSLILVLRAQNIPFEPTLTVGNMRKLLRSRIRQLLLGKQVENNVKLQDIRESWPHPVGRALKDTVTKLFREELSSDNLAETTCASCAESCLLSSSTLKPIDEIDLNIFHARDRDSLSVNNIVPRAPYNDGPLENLVLDPAGVVDVAGKLSLRLCSICYQDVRKKKLPRLSLANELYIGMVPEELKDLTAIEESMISLCRAKCWIVQMKEDGAEVSLPHAQRGMRGHVIIYPQRPEMIAKMLPPSIADIVTPVCVIFIGSKPPSRAWLKDKARPLVARADRIRRALVWLKTHNPLYADITINESVLQEIPLDGLLPFHIDHVDPSAGQTVLQSRYDAHPAVHDAFTSFSTEDKIPFENVVISDVEGHASSDELRAAAVRHIKIRGGDYLKVPHAEAPVNEFGNPALFPMIYPTLFPYGIGGCEDSERRRQVSLKAHVKHLFSLADRRFQEHPSFMFTTFNILQRRSLLLHTSIKVKRSNFSSVADMFANVSCDAVHRVVERVQRGDSVSAHDNDERKVLNLMKQVNVVTSHVPGSSASKEIMRNEMRGLMMHLGLPSFFVTINPADIYNPLVKFLGGSQINLDNLPSSDVPQYREQAFLVADNPTVAAKFFNLYMKAFYKTLLGFDPKQENLTGGILGVVKGFYGCVEAQGRGTLHCHMLIWVEGGLNPNEIRAKIVEEGNEAFRDRLLSFLDDSISNAIPVDPDPSLNIPSSTHHPCTVRGLSIPGEHGQIEREKDLHHIAKACQQHSHTDTCYKYCKEGDRKECRFGMDADNYEPISTFDIETGELRLRCLDGLVNNFNDTIIQAIRCNMDIKFIGSGPTAKAILYYITNYISKAQLKTHVTFAALELAITKLGEYNPLEDLITLRAKQMLQKCAAAMISHQELSAQQVCTYLNEYEDHYTSHQYRKLYWMNFERYLNNEAPSPECYTKDDASPANVTVPETDNENVEDHDIPADEAIILEDFPEDDALSADQVIHNINSLTEEVSIEVDEDGVLVQRSPYVMDYVQRGTLLDCVSLWDFNAQVDKKKRIKVSVFAAHDDVPDTEEDVPDAEEDDSDPGSDEDNADALPPAARLPEDDFYETNDNILDKSNRIRPKCNFLPNHADYVTHFQLVRQPLNRYVNVPTGMGIPRRDKAYSRARHARLMLLLFRPWHRVSDIKEDNRSWVDTYDEFYSGLAKGDYVKTVIDNMQVLHECKDSRDDHFNNRRNHRRNFISQDLMGMGRAVVNDDLGNEVDDIDLLTHLNMVDSCHSTKINKANANVEECVTHAESSGLFSSCGKLPGEAGYEDSSEWAHLVDIKDINVEVTWKAAYDLRRERWKRKETAPQTTDSGIDIPAATANGDEMRLALAAPDTMSPPSPQIVHSMLPEDLDRDISLENVMNTWGLNSEQRRAFSLVAEKSLNRSSDPLKMYIAGPAGTGKSQVINALRDFFQQRNQQRRFRVCCYMGIAARNVGGMTLHAALSLNDRKKKGSKRRSDTELMSRWDGVDFLFIDEVSMISCRLLCQVSAALSIAKGNPKAFGGINIIFAGDFAQLPPVADHKLYGRIKGKINSATEMGQDIAMGKVLWFSVLQVVILTTQYRQRGDENAAFVHLLERLRIGRCTQEDYECLNTRVLDNCKPNLKEKKWIDAPIIVYDNATKDALNKRCAARFAQDNERTLHWYYPVDKYKSQPVVDVNLIKHLRNLPSNITSQRLGMLPLALGMPVIVSQNFDVEGGVVNGSRGVVKSIRYYVDKGERYLKSCVVTIPSASLEDMPNLPSQDMPILQDSVSLQFKHPHTGRMCTIRRSQVPIVPAFAMTAHRAQGQTISNVIVDLQSCHGTESPYVMISRVTSLDGLLILRPFDKDKITCRQSEESRRENSRLYILNLQTTVIAGNPSESRLATEELTKLGVRNAPDALAGVPYSERNVDRFVLLDRLHSAHIPSHSVRQPPSRRLSRQPLPSTRRVALQPVVLDNVETPVESIIHPVTSSPSGMFTPSRRLARQPLPIPARMGRQAGSTIRQQNPLACLSGDISGSMTDTTSCKFTHSTQSINSILSYRSDSSCSTASPGVGIASSSTETTEL